MKEVKVKELFIESGDCTFKGELYVLKSDYDALLTENQRYREALEEIVVDATKNTDLFADHFLQIARNALKGDHD